eukprot:g12140.t1
MRLNTKIRKPQLYTHEGGPAARLSDELALRRSVMACLLWEDTFYESGMSIAERIAELVPRVAPETVAAMAVEARQKMKLRHVPLLLVNEMTKYDGHRKLVAGVLDKVIRRADEPGELIAMYWADGGRRPLPAQVKKGIASAFARFDAYQLAKYDRPAQVSLRDVMFLVHPKPVDEAQAEAFAKLAERDLAPADTWEVALSAGGWSKTRVDKRYKWERLLTEGKLGPLALLRNLRNMSHAGVDRMLIRRALRDAKVGNVLPMRFVAAATHAPKFEPELEALMLKRSGEMPKLAGTTVILVDVSYSMFGVKVSKRSEMDRLSAASALAMLARERCEDAIVYTFSYEAVRLRGRRGFALRDEIMRQDNGGTNLGKAVLKVNRDESFDRLIVITDEQTSDKVTRPDGKGYILNVGTYKNGVGYGDRWAHVDGWSESVLDYIHEIEQAQLI